jgi:hypothetical protein
MTRDSAIPLLERGLTVLLWFLPVNVKLRQIHTGRGQRVSLRSGEPWI